jgi:CRISPR-associated protein Csy3
MAKTELSTASVLAFERKLDPSDGLFSAGRWSDATNSANWPAIAIKNPCAAPSPTASKPRTRTRPSSTPPSSPQPANGGCRALPNNADTLRLRFTLRARRRRAPAACNNADYQAKLLDTVQAYKDEHGFGELARRYAINLANGRFLWRNRVGAEQIASKSATWNGEPRQSWSFDALPSACGALMRRQTRRARSPGLRLRLQKGWPASATPC